MGQNSFDTIYKNAPRDRVDELLKFRSTHPIQYRLIDGMKWDYILSGAGSETVLIMSGSGGTAETAYRTIMNLEKKYRILSLSYPPYTKMSEFVDGLVKFSDLEGIQHVHFIGTSFGSAVGHVLVRRHRNRIDKLILSSCGLYSERILRLTKRFFSLFQFLPYWAISRYKQLIIPKFLTGLEKEEKLFQLAYFSDLRDLQNNKQMLMSQYHMMVDMCENTSIYDLYKPIESNRVLIIQVKDDTSFDQNEQAALRQTYPNAHVHLFKEGGHFREITHQAEHDAIIHKFLESEVG